eukprot:TRINITY_DN46305_c0_g1_i1.p1 TRINITY_DN46305_c0_g1~~TRINITY_DN46305_c0_g1_i1.p1  ORF type:complete len:1332 (-),score=238.39 TRINITY_DN46305_c0_g1_i1:94-4089(-)
MLSHAPGFPLRGPSPQPIIDRGRPPPSRILSTSLRHDGHVETVMEREAEWDKCDKAQTKLFEYQWKIITEQMSQISALVDGLAVLNQEVQVLKGEHSERVDALQTSLKQCVNLEYHTASLQRIDNLEAVVGNSCDKHAKSVDETHRLLGGIRGLHESLEERLTRTEAAAVDGASRLEAWENEATKLHRQIESIEKFAGESIDKSAKAMDSLHIKMNSWHEAVAAEKNAREHLDCMVQKRVGYLESFLGDSVGKHSKGLEDLCEQHATVERRLTQLEQSATGTATICHRMEKELNAFRETLHDSTEHHRSRFEEAQGSMQDVLSRHVAAEQRIAYAEKLLAELADQSVGHSRSMDDTRKHIQDCHAHVKSESEMRERHHGSLQQRVDKLESLLGESVDKHSNDWTDAHEKIRNVFDKVRACEERIDGETEARGSHHCTVEQRISYLEKKIGDCADQHQEEIQDVRNQLLVERRSRDEQHGAIQLRFDDARQNVENLHGHRATIEERIASLEKELGNVGDRQEETRQSLHGVCAQIRDETHGREQHHATVQQRVELLEKRVGEFSDKHASALDETQRKLERFHGHHATIEDRLIAMEKEVTSLTDKHDDGRRRMNEYHMSAQNEAQVSEQRHSTLQQRLECLDKHVRTSFESHAHGFDDLRRDIERFHVRHLSIEERVAHLGDRHDDAQKHFHEYSSNAQNEVRAFEQNHVFAIQRIDNLEQMLGDGLLRHARGMESTQSASDALQSSQMTIGDRLTALEKRAAHSAEMHEETNRRADNIQVEIKNNIVAREHHHSCMQDRIDVLEQLVKQTAEVHCQRMDDTQKNIEHIHAHRATIEDRVVLLEKEMGSSVDRHEESKQRIQECHLNMKSETKAREEHTDTVRKRLDALEASIAGVSKTCSHSLDDVKSQVDRFVRQHAEVEERVISLEVEVGSAGEKHNETVQKMNEHNATMQSEARARECKHATLQQRLDFIEQTIGDSASKHSQSLDEAQRQLESVHASHTTIECRLTSLEKELGNITEKHDEARQDLRDCRHVMQNETQAREQHHSALQQRVMLLEKMVGDSAVKHAQGLERHGLAEQRLAGLEAKATELLEKTEVHDSHHVTSRQQISSLETQVVQSMERLAKESEVRHEFGETIDQRLQHMEAFQLQAGNVYVTKVELDKLRGNLEQVYGHVASEAELRESRHVTLEQRVEFLECKVCDTAGKHAKELEVAAAMAQEQLELAARVTAIAKDFQASEDTRSAELRGRVSSAPRSVGSPAALLPSSSSSATYGYAHKPTSPPLAANISSAFASASAREVRGVASSAINVEPIANATASSLVGTMRAAS